MLTRGCDDSLDANRWKQWLINPSTLSAFNYLVSSQNRPYEINERIKTQTGRQRQTHLSICRCSSSRKALFTSHLPRDARLPANLPFLYHQIHKYCLKISACSSSWNKQQQQLGHRRSAPAALAPEWGISILLTCHSAILETMRSRRLAVNEALDLIFKPGPDED